MHRSVTLFGFFYRLNPPEVDTTFTQLVHHPCAPRKSKTIKKVFCSTASFSFPRSFPEILVDVCVLFLLHRHRLAMLQRVWRSVFYNRIGNRLIAPAIARSGGAIFPIFFNFPEFDAEMCSSTSRSRNQSKQQQQKKKHIIRRENYEMAKLPTNKNSKNLFENVNK